ncbi:MAG: peptidoglycan DD-metalloendopeptidase family protein [Candidatus Parcubacteria bacterium]|nr:peptidoglycan DD-metalloendopeptidase family protein [Burkholderiales bacterium]
MRKFMGGISPIRRAALLAAFTLFGTVAAIASIVPSTDAGLLVAKTAVLEPVAIHLDEALLPPPASYIREDRLQRGDTFQRLLSRLAIGETDIQKLLRQRELRLLRTGTIVTAEVRSGADSEGELVWLGFLAAGDRNVRIERVGKGLVATEERAQIVTRTELKTAVIRSSLFAAADAAGIPDGVAIQLANVFASDVDFHRELRQGDRFSVLYETHSIDGRQMRSGRVLAAEFSNQGRRHRAVWFADSYYAPDGKNLRKALLRSPLELSRVSSGFGLRMHPIHKSWRAHQGVDYAAPSGTRVRSVGDGIVEFAGRQGGYGNLVIVRHDSRNSTYYAHLSALGNGVRKGARIAQGDTVGLVGQTGWATGPHLHYEFRVEGAARNPLSVPLPAAAPIARHDLPAFRARAHAVTAQLDLLSNRQVAALE